MSGSMRTGQQEPALRLQHRMPWRHHLPSCHWTSLPGALDAAQHSILLLLDCAPWPLMLLPWIISNESWIFHAFPWNWDFLVVKMADVNYIPSVALTETVSQIWIYSLEFLDKEKTVVFAVSSGGESHLLKQSALSDFSNWNNCFYSQAWCQFRQAGLEKNPLFTCLLWFSSLVRW